MTVSNPTIEKLIPNWVDLYTEALEDNFRHYKVNMLTNNSARYTGAEKTYQHMQRSNFKQFAMAQTS